MKMICHKCVGDDFLKDRIRQEGTVSKCGFCKSRVKSVTVEELSEWVGNILDEHFHPGNQWPVMGDGDDDRISYFEQDGEELDQIISTIIDADGYLIDAVIEELTTLPHWEIADGGEPHYDKETNYVERQVNSYLVEEEWSAFKYELHHRSRFFNDFVRQFLDRLMKDLDELYVPGLFNNSVFRTINPEDFVVYYRARLADKPNELHSILKNANDQLGPPPPELAVAGRMNAEGIPVFYGALDRKTCVAELRPSLGSTVLSGVFELIKPVKVLDFRLLEKAYHDHPLSYFQPDFNERVTYRILLKRLHKKIRQPILPGSENEYLITQVLADYLVNMLKPSIDGILFSSVQNEKGLNIVLFSHVLDIQINSDRASIMGTNSALKYKDNSLKIHRIKSIEYGSIDHEPKAPVADHDILPHDAFDVDPDEDGY